MPSQKKSLLIKRSARYSRNEKQGICAAKAIRACALQPSAMPEGDKIKREIERKKAERKKQSSQLMKWVILILIALMLSSSVLALLFRF